MARRIPGDQPYLVRPNASRRAVLFSALLLVILLMMVCPMGLAVLDGADPVDLLILLAGVAVAVGLLFGVQLWLLLSGGPVLAVGPAGLWIKTRPTWGKAVWLPWEAIERIYPRRWGLEKVVCVQPVDPGTGRDAVTALDPGLRQVFSGGTGFTAPLNFADRPGREVMAALEHYSAGRCRIG